MNMDNKSHTYAFDFDGVITQYDGFRGVEYTGEPNASVVEAIRALKRLGHKIIVHSTRGDASLRAYCTEHDIPFDYINCNPERESENPGKPIAYAYIDDRAVCYRGQSAEQLVEELTSFRVYWQKAE